MNLSEITLKVVSIIFMILVTANAEICYNLFEFFNILTQSAFNFTCQFYTWNDM